MTIADLPELMTYQNEAVVLRFLETWELPRADADDLFVETKKWPWLSAKVTAMDPAPTLAISPSTKLIDEMWHTFILFTRDYQDFCDRYLGGYLHHVPTPRRTYEVQIARFEGNPEGYLEDLRRAFSAQYEIIYDLLGENTLVKWYSEYLEKYTDEAMQRAWRWSFSPYDTRTRHTLRLASGQADHV